jgi:hypothetical protein
MFASDNRHAAMMRLGWVVVVLCAVIFAQTVSLAAEHSHQHPSQHCCALCHSGPLPFVLMSVGTTVLPALAVIGLALSDDSGGAPEQLSSIESSRAPPA